MSYKRYWIVLSVVMLGSFAVLGGVGRKMISEAPPLPNVYSTGGHLLFTGSTITEGQGVWQSIGGQEIGTVWGHGAYVAPDWSADWLHRESNILLDRWAQHDGAANFAALDIDRQAILKARLIREIRTNTYDAKTNSVTLSADRAAAFEQLEAYYTGVFANGRSEYAIPRGALTDAAKQKQLAAFFWWSAWATGTNRPGTSVTYTNNWPHEPLVANNLTPGAILWSIVSVVGLLAGIGGLVWWYSSQEKLEVNGPYPQHDPFLGLHPTPSQRATIKYFLVVVALWGVQILMGALTAHYGVEGKGFYGFPLDKYVPYAITRTWHIQLAIFWIATSWLATGLYVGPAVSGHEPKFQRLGVNVLFVALVFVVGGSLAGEWLGIQQKLGNLWFWFGDQGYDICGPRTLLANLALRRPRPLARADGPRSQARPHAQKRRPRSALALPHLLHRHPALLRRRPDVRPAQQPRHRRILALVGRSPLGRGILRGLRHCGHCVPFHAPQAA